MTEETDNYRDVNLVYLTDNVFGIILPGGVVGIASTLVEIPSYIVIGELRDNLRSEPILSSKSSFFDFLVGEDIEPPRDCLDSETFESGLFYLLKPIESSNLYRKYEIKKAIMGVNVRGDLDE